jgi:hypothetical protein
MGSNRPRWGSVRLLEKRDGSSEGSGADNYAHLQPSNDPSRFLTVRRTCPAGRVGSDTEEVTGSNPVAPSTVLAGQGPLSSWRTALLTCRGRAAAAGCSPPNQVGPSELDDMGPPRAQRPLSVVRPPGPGPMVRHHAGHLHRTPCRADGHLLSPCSPTRPAARRQPWATADSRASQPWPTSYHRFPSGPMPAGDHAARGPRRHVDPPRPTEGSPPHRATPGPSAARTARQRADTGGLSSRHPGCTGRLDTGCPLDPLETDVLCWTHRSGA